MSSQDRAFRGDRRPPGNPNSDHTLEVFVRDWSGPPPIFPETITLTDDIYWVRWNCARLEQGHQLQIHFPQDPNGPFIVLEPRPKGNKGQVIGRGNRGPEHSLKKYTYKAQILGRGGEVRVLGTGHVINEATQEIPAWRGGPGEPPPKDPVG